MTRAPWRRAGRDTGAASVLVVAVVAVLLTATAATMTLAEVSVTRHRAAAAADLAAVAGAAALPGVGAPPCERAAEIAAANGAQLEECEVAGPAVGVQVAVDSRARLGSGTVHARARARRDFTGAAGMPRADRSVPRRPPDTPMAGP
ncbi:MAG: hypothetical protein JWM93_1122 [Frankiales bacterium]|nr:hypothetical protein [Frankiales bacterium]